MDVRIEVYARAELLMAIDRILRFMASEAPFATEVVAIMLGNVAH